MCARFRCVCVRFRCVCVRFRCVCVFASDVHARASDVCVFASDVCVCEHFSCVCVCFRCVCACVLQCAENFSHSARLLLQQSWAFYTLALCLRAVLISSPDTWDWRRMHVLKVMHRRTLHENVDSAKIKVPFYTSDIDILRVASMHRIVIHCIDISMNRYTPNYCRHRKKPRGGTYWVWEPLAELSVRSRWRWEDPPHLYPASWLGGRALEGSRQRRQCLVSWWRTGHLTDTADSEEQPATEQHGFTSRNTIASTY